MTRAGHSECLAQDARGGFRKMIFEKFFFAGKDDVGHIAAGTWFSTDALTKIIDDYVVVLGLGFVFRGDGAVGAENAVENFNEFDHPHLKAGFFQQFTGDALFEGFAELQRAARDGPLATQGFAAAADQQSAVVFNDYASNADDRPFGVFAGRCHNLRVQRPRLSRKQPGRSWELTSCAAVYNTLHEGGRAVGDAGLGKSDTEDGAVIRCPECSTEIDVDEDEVEEGEILSCPECESELEVSQTHPVHLNLISDDEDDDDEEEEKEGAENGDLLKEEKEEDEDEEEEEDEE